ncbi:class I SAM-dependent methyltransferase [Acidilutibacter cellobiosedens]|jgi:16S rRNA (guanine1207-N2)-methyltransferase|uniref:Class I SAM-dependent methyltransferase n=1 Tax=Acidilutibacter cellobiosedens TaxID=2507161 RepID=A0A410QFP6_9FIRM|nr:methyltransferase [Acidilutibacter cellobiosedens]QAT62912.1 class I SAM-dependent methyltransferase [Acidilutibacter cellobiosedens]
MIKTIIKEVGLQFDTSDKVFSPSAIDKGTSAMLAEVEFFPTDKVLDLGCGYGVVGILAAKMIGEDNVVMCDISEEAIRLAKKNAEYNLVGKVNIVRSNGFEHIRENDFTIILSNPPYHADFSVAKNFIENSFNRLILGGKLLMVTKRFDWYKNKITAVFGGCKVIERDGYFIFIAEKRSDKKPVKKKIQQHLSKKLERKKRKQT